MTWSFSRVNSYATCPYGWKLHYIDHVPQESSGFAEWGSLCHSIFEDYAKGNLAEYELLDAYDERYSEYMHSGFPPSRGGSLADKYYERGRELFATFDGFPDNLEILGVEQEVHLDVGGWHFIGYIDLLGRDKDTGKLVVIDHKSKSRFKSKEEQEHYTLQLYLYAQWVYEKYGEYPDRLVFNMFRVDDVVTIPFSKDDLEKAKKWFVDTIHAMEEDTDFWDKIALTYDKQSKPLSTYQCNDFFCKYLCGSRLSCQRSGLMITEE